jgi:hypothetical protein
MRLIVHLTEQQPGQECARLCDVESNAARLSKPYEIQSGWGEPHPCLEWQWSARECAGRTDAREHCLEWQWSARECAGRTDAREHSGERPKMCGADVLDALRIRWRPTPRQGCNYSELEWRRCCGLCGAWGKHMDGVSSSADAGRARGPGTPMELAGKR